ncbi:N-acetylmuramoyl-L-alanine amidase [Dankookia rubra]|uniref:N-acetylmuramoyl-L-alanine amidase n=1 Tax=Dankookia rubra TaxID=1442381 RepID=A0A4R5Q9K4_9PROT|nr:peptidoglycan recognition family protein [Dankookia rubra]TDH59198.1 N-acetylmuramoyl-L-alanine amidase [Dankookia rubra]
MKVTWKGCAASNFRAGRPPGFKPEAIVIHIMDGTLAGTDSWFNNPAAQVSAHYGVGVAGQVHQYVNETDTAFHAGKVIKPSWQGLKQGVNPNFYTIGIEHEGRGDAAYPWGAPQLDASLALVAEVARRWGIPLDDQHIVSHHQIRADKPCPGRNFDLADYVGRLRLVRPPAGPKAIAQAAPSLTAVALARVRQEPRADAAVVQVLSEGASFVPTAVIDDGEPLGGNPLWYADLSDPAKPAYLWAGATDRPSGI